METIPLIESEYDKWHHSLMVAPGEKILELAWHVEPPRATSVTAVQAMPLQLCIVALRVEMAVGTALRAYIVCGNQVTRVTRAYIDEGGELLMPRMLRKQSGGNCGSRIQKKATVTTAPGLKERMFTQSSSQHIIKIVPVLYFCIIKLAEWVIQIVENMFRLFHSKII